jgi:uncharacterized membrane protein
MSRLAFTLDKHRLGGLQDATYGIAMTLLVLELKLPHVGEHADSAALWHALSALLPKILIWLLSFWVLAKFWLGEALLLKAVAAVDRTLARLSMAQLALVSLLPFSTAVIGEHGDLAPAAAVYALHILALALLSWLRLSHVARGTEGADASTMPLLAASRLRAQVTVACAAAALGLAFVVPGFNMLALVPILALQVLPTKG